jgi:hypothetical protein
MRTYDDEAASWSRNNLMKTSGCSPQMMKMITTELIK